ncbi:MAG: glycosyltransferase [Bacillota bacterium]
MAVLMLALYGLVTAVLDLAAWLGARNAQAPAVSLVSILVLINNREDIIERFLRRVCSIGIAGASVPYEVIAVDNYSSDQTWSIIHRLSSSMKMLKVIRMGDVSAPDECPESIGLFMCSGDISIVCRLATDTDDLAIVTALRTMLNKPRRERPVAFLG